MVEQTDGRMVELTEGRMDGLTDNGQRLNSKPPFFFKARVLLLHYFSKPVFGKKKKHVLPLIHYVHLIKLKTSLLKNLYFETYYCTKFYDRSPFCWNRSPNELTKLSVENLSQIFPKNRCIQHE